MCGAWSGLNLNIYGRHVWIGDTYEYIFFIKLHFPGGSLSGHQQERSAVCILANLFRENTGEFPKTNFPVTHFLGISQNGRLCASWSACCVRIQEISQDKLPDDVVY